MYNLSKLESPRNLLTSLNGEDVEFAKHRARKIPKYQIARADSYNDPESEGLIGKFLDLFTLKAEARTRRDSDQ